MAVFSFPVLAGFADFVLVECRAEVRDNDYRTRHRLALLSGYLWERNGVAGYVRNHCTIDSGQHHRHDLYRCSW